MGSNEILSRLDQVKARRLGEWSARCPAHPDKNPSLTIRAGERGLLLKCWAGCTLEEICQALGCRVSDLFLERKSESRKRRTVPPRPARFDWQVTAWRFRFHAMLLWLRVQDVLNASSGQDTSTWSIEEHEAAMRAVGKAYQDIERADFLEEVAFDIRAKGLAKEREHAQHSYAA